MATKISKDRIQQLFNFKANRAVDVLFTENRLDQVHEIYATLQQYKKSNTSELKKTLENNYEKMLYCSDLLNETKKYAAAVHSVAQQIETQVIHNNNKSAQKQKKQENLIERAEKLLAHHKFHQAIIETNKNQNQLSSQDKYFIFYLRIEIINKMERHICMNKLAEARLKQYSQCLLQFLFTTHQDGIGLIDSFEQWAKDFKPKSILGIANKRIDFLREVNRQVDCWPIVYEILFQFKLTMLKNRFKIRMSSHMFQEYFEQLGIILRLYRSLNARGSRLSLIFEQATPQIKNQLASIFIQRKQTGQIIFKCQLYDELIKNQNIEKTIQLFYDEISSSGIKVQHPLKFIKQLWYNYFLNLIDLSLEQVNPLARIPSLKQHLNNYEHIPDQLKLFLHDYGLDQSLNIIKQYSGKIQLLRKNILPIANRCTSDELISFNNKFNEKVQALSQGCFSFMNSQIFRHPSTLSLRKYLLLRVQCGMLANQIKFTNQQCKLQLKQQKILSIFNQINLSLFWNCFAVNDNGHYEFFQTFTAFDNFYIGYIQGCKQQIRPILLDAICQTSMKMLTQIQIQIKGREKQTLEHTIQTLKHKKQKVTILQKIVVPYLAERIFQCEMKKIKMQNSFYDAYFKSNSENVKFKSHQMDVQDDFQIGQKEQKEEFIKAKKGKSIMNISNNFITGLMMKKK